MLSISVNPLSKVPSDGVCAIRGKAVMTAAARSKNLRELDIIIFAPCATNFYGNWLNDQFSEVPRPPGQGGVDPLVSRRALLPLLVATIGPKTASLSC